MENKINIGDYVTQESIVKNNAIFEVIFFEFLAQILAQTLFRSKFIN